MRRYVPLIAALFVLVLQLGATAALGHDCSSAADCEETAGYNGTIALIGGIIAIIAGIFGTQIGGPVEPTVVAAPPEPRPVPAPSAPEPAATTAQPPAPPSPPPTAPEPVVTMQTAPTAEAPTTEPPTTEPATAEAPTAEEPTTPPPPPTKEEPVTTATAPTEPPGRPPAEKTEEPSAPQEPEETKPPEETTETPPEATKLPEETEPPVVTPPQRTPAAVDPGKAPLQEPLEKISETAGAVKDAVDKAKETLDDLPISDASKEKIKEGLDKVGGPAGDIKEYADTAKEYVDALDDNLQKTGKMGISEDSQNFLGWWRVTFKAIGDVTERFIDKVTSPVTGFIKETTGHDAEKTMHDLVPIKEFGDELSKLPTSAAQSVVKAQNRDQIDENRDELADIYPDWSKRK